MKHNDRSIEKPKLIHWACLIFVLPFIYISPYHKGLFHGESWGFEGPIYTAILWGSMGLIIIISYHFMNKSDNYTKLMLLCIWLIPLSYLLSTINAASKHSSELSLYVSILWAIFFSVALVLGENGKARKLAVNGVLISFAIITLYGLMNWFGFAHYNEAVLNGRLAGVLQYPNTYAAILISSLFGMIHLLIQQRESKTLTIVYMVMLIPTMLSLLLTMSRGGYFSFVIIMLLYFSMIRDFSRQLKALFYLLASGICSLLMLKPVVTLRIRIEEGFSWQYALFGYGLILLSSMLFLLVVRYISVLKGKGKIKFADKQLPSYLVPLGLLILLICLFIAISIPILQSLLPQSLVERINAVDSSQFTTLIRGEYFNAALALSKDYFWFGAGGGGWFALYAMYQAVPYTGNQAHSFYMQHLNATGLIGIISLVIVIISVFIAMTRKSLAKYIDPYHVVSLIVAASILMHAIIDFDMSFVYVSVLVFFALGLSASIVAYKDWNVRRKSIKSFQKWILMGVLVLAFIFIIVRIPSYIQANNSYKIVVDGLKTNRLLADQISKSFEKHRSNPTYGLMKLQLHLSQYNQTKEHLQLTEAQKVIEDLYAAEPYNPTVLQQKFYVENVMGNYHEALTALVELRVKHPWKFEHYEQAIKYAYQVWNAQKDNNTEEVSYYWTSALESYEELTQRIQVTETENVRNKRGFRVTPQIASMIGQIYYEQNRFEEAKNVLGLKLSRNPQSDLEREIVIYYLAALSNLGEEDNKLETALLKRFPEDNERLNSLRKEKG